MKRSQNTAKKLKQSIPEVQIVGQCTSLQHLAENRETPEAEEKIHR